MPTTTVVELRQIRFGSCLNFIPVKWLLRALSRAAVLSLRKASNRSVF